MSKSSCETLTQYKLPRIAPQMLDGRLNHSVGRLKQGCMPQASEQAAEFLRRLALCGRNLGEHDSAAKPSARELLLAGDIRGIAQLDGPLAAVLAEVINRNRSLQHVSPRDSMTLQVSQPS